MQDSFMLLVLIILYFSIQAVPPVIHRDIKSSNILLDQSMRARVCSSTIAVSKIPLPFFNAYPSRVIKFLFGCNTNTDCSSLLLDYFVCLEDGFRLPLELPCSWICFINQVADFGLSREEMVDRHAANVRGTFGYLDPEYISTRAFTKKSDVYSFGVLLFELVAGRNPQQGLMEYIELVRF